MTRWLILMWTTLLIIGFFLYVITVELIKFTAGLEIPSETKAEIMVIIALTMTLVWLLLVMGVLLELKSSDS